MKARVSFSLCLPPSPPSLLCSGTEPWVPCPPLCLAGMKAGAGCWDGRLSRGGGGGGEEGEGEGEDLLITQNSSGGC